MAKDAIPLGKLIETTESRDAVHIAIAPTIAGTWLKPGEHISIIDGKAFRGGETIGVVDPFLKSNVKQGQKFFICLYPGSITSLKHHWEHPAFSSEKPEKTQEFDNPSSREWITRFAERLGYDYEEMIHAAKNYLRDGRYFNGGSRFEGESVPDEFWDHFEKSTGINVEYDNRNNFFSCAC